MANKADNDASTDICMKNCHIQKREWGKKTGEKIKGGKVGRGNQEPSRKNIQTIIFMPWMYAKPTPFSYKTEELGYIFQKDIVTSWNNLKDQIC